MDLQQILEIEVPTNKEINEMSVEELEAWLQKLYPFYIERSEILEKFGFEAWEKAYKWLGFHLILDNIQKGDFKWSRVSSEFDWLKEESSKDEAKKPISNFITE